MSVSAERVWDELFDFWVAAEAKPPKQDLVGLCRNTEVLDT